MIPGKDSKGERRGFFSPPNHSKISHTQSKLDENRTSTLMTSKTSGLPVVNKTWRKESNVGTSPSSLTGLTLPRPVFLPSLRSMADPEELAAIRKAEEDAARLAREAEAERIKQLKAKDAQRAIEERLQNMQINISSDWLDDADIDYTLNPFGEESVVDIDSVSKQTPESNHKFPTVSNVEAPLEPKNIIKNGITSKKFVLSKEKTLLSPPSSKSSNLDAPTHQKISEPSGCSQPKNKLSRDSDRRVPLVGDFDKKLETSLNPDQGLLRTSEFNFPAHQKSINLPQLSHNSPIPTGEKLGKTAPRSSRQPRSQKSSHKSARDIKMSTSDPRKPESLTTDLSGQRFYSQHSKQKVVAKEMQHSEKSADTSLDYYPDTPTPCIKLENTILQPSSETSDSKSTEKNSVDSSDAVSLSITNSSAANSSSRTEASTKPINTRETNMSNRKDESSNNQTNQVVKNKVFPESFFQKGSWRSKDHKLVPTIPLPTTAPILVSSTEISSHSQTVERLKSDDDNSSVVSKLEPFKVSDSEVACISISESLNSNRQVFLQSPKTPQSSIGDCDSPLPIITHKVTEITKHKNPKRQIKNNSEPGNKNHSKPHSIPGLMANVLCKEKPIAHSSSRHTANSDKLGNTGSDKSRTETFSHINESTSELPNKSDEKKESFNNLVSNKNRGSRSRKNFEKTEVLSERPTHDTNKNILNPTNSVSTTSVKNSFSSTNRKLVGNQNSSLNQSPKLVYSTSSRLEKSNFNSAKEQSQLLSNTKSVTSLIRQENVLLSTAPVTNGKTQVDDTFQSAQSENSSKFIKKRSRHSHSKKNHDRLVAPEYIQEESKSTTRQITIKLDRDEESSPKTIPVQLPGPPSLVFGTLAVRDINHSLRPSVLSGIRPSATRDPFVQKDV